jgi:hypothetical protein
MSDFGARVSVFRVDGQPLSEDEERKVRSAGRSLQFSRPDRIGPYDEFDLRFGTACAVNGTKGLSVGLSSYFVGDREGNGGLEPEVIIAREEPIAAQFAEELACVVGDEFRTDSYSGYW